MSAIETLKHLLILFKVTNKDPTITLIRVTGNFDVFIADCEHVFQQQNNYHKKY